MFLVPNGCINLPHSSRYGKEVIALPDGSKVYAMQEKWGLHYSRLSITQNPSGCQPANPDTDYIFNDIINNIMVYKVKDEGLFIIDRDGYWREPRTPWTKNKPTFELLTSDMFNHPEKYAITILREYSNQWCFRNPFRSSTSLRPDILKQELEQQRMETQVQ